MTLRIGISKKINEVYKSKRTCIRILKGHINHLRHWNYQKHSKKIAIKRAAITGPFQLMKRF